MHDTSEILEPVRRSVSAFFQTRARESVGDAEGALQRIFTPHFFPNDLSTLLTFSEKIRHFSLPIIGFNGQVVRAAVLLKMLRMFGCDAFVETGTNRGDTSLLIAAQTTLPIFSCELNGPAHRLAYTVLAPFGDRVQVTLGDSRQFLDLFLNTSECRRPFFYLDAHWNADIPLLEELRLIISHLTDFIIVADDFKVPADAGFKYDSYSNIAFELPYIAPILRAQARKLCILYPSYPSESETGAKRGFLMITPRQNGSEIRSVVDQNFLSEPFSM
jgi:hypothetical protein